MAVDIPIHLPIIDYEKRSSMREIFEGYWSWYDNRRITIVSRSNNVTYYEINHCKNNWHDTLFKVMLLFTLAAPIIGAVFLAINYYERSHQKFELWQPPQYPSRLSKIKQKLSAPIPLDYPNHSSFNVHHHPILCEKTNKAGSYSFSTSSTQGLRRTMEDQHIGTKIFLNDGTSIPLFAVMDGHGGKECSWFLKDYFPKLFSQEMSNFDWKNSNEEEKYDFLKNFSKLLDNGVLTFVTDESGSTMVASFIIDNELWVMNTGDSRAVLSNNGKAIQLSEDAKLNKLHFLKHIYKHGGYLSKNRLNGALGLARAYGDSHKGSKMTGLTAAAKIKKFNLSDLDDNYLILACDGLWDVLGSQEAVDHLNYRDLELSGAHLVDLALKNGSMDNVTAMIINLNK